MGRSREHWVDAAKGLAILLVVVFHGFLGLHGADLFPGSVVWWGCNEAVYCFHVQLLFLCSGYLRQRYGRSGGCRAHVCAALGKVWCLGVPYLVFATLSWTLKTLCAQWVNHPAGAWWEDLVLEPAAPYWFLPTLALLFALLPRTDGKRAWACLFAAAVAAKAATVAWDCADWAFPVRTVAQQAFWFAAGMGLARLEALPTGGKGVQWLGAACAVLFAAGAAAATSADLWAQPRWEWCKAAKWGLGVLACTAVLAWAVRRGGARSSPGVWEWLGRNTLPFFLMHTLFAAAVRMALAALGVRFLWLHVPAMLAASIAGPLAAMRVLERVHLDGLVDPRRWHVRRNAPAAARIGLSNGEGRR